ncbi:serine/threonine-protein kinase [soil metagenome]
MGAVWLAHDEVLGREVALKRIGLVPGADSTDLARAEREAQLTARLNHPRVVSVFNFVVDADTDTRWLVMEYVDGVTLSQLVKDQGPLSPDDAAPLMWQAADALVAAHAAGIVHRDVKPSNILVDRSHKVKLTDFGIARIATDPALTQTGLVTVSPAYLAPEIATGERGGEASDVWSLGATLFHVLSGRPPYDMGDNVLSGLYRIVHEDPPRLPEADWMAPLLDATLVKDPRRRWSMVEVRDFLAGPGGRAAAPAPVTEPEGTRETATLASSGRPFWGRPAGVLRAGLLASLVLVAAVFAFFIGRGPSTDTASERPSDTPAASPSKDSPIRLASASASPSQAAAAAPKPTSRGMESFIRGYVAAISTDPDTAWPMLTPKFQDESGGLEKYRSFWGDVGAAQILDVSADPSTLVVSYRVRFDNFGTGRRPTVLDLVFDRGAYRINGERTLG